MSPLKKEKIRIFSDFSRINVRIYPSKNPHFLVFILKFLINISVLNVNFVIHVKNISLKKKKRIYYYSITILTKEKKSVNVGIEVRIVKVKVGIPRKTI